MNTEPKEFAPPTSTDHTPSSSEGEGSKKEPSELPKLSSDEPTSQQQPQGQGGGGGGGGGGKTVVEFYGAGTVLGELGVLENKNRIASIECETPVRVRTPLLHTAPPPPITPHNIIPPPPRPSCWTMPTCSRS